MRSKNDYCFSETNFYPVPRLSTYCKEHPTNGTSNTHQHKDSEEIQDIAISDMSDVGDFGRFFTTQKKKHS